MNIFDNILNGQRTQGFNDNSPINNPSLDPRPDLTQDHRHWVRILTNAKELFDTHRPINGHLTSLFKILHGLRCAGCRLEETKQGYKLHPGNEEYANPAKWEEDKRRWLAPVREELVQLFRLSKIGETVQEELPAGVFEKKMPEQQQQISWNIG